MTGKKARHGEISCFKCRYFYITYDSHFPYGCRAVGFKSHRMPSREMYANSGMECQLFQKKDEKQ
ncbi:MAG TPA: uracil-DNA glycosylase [Deltaproteobacteria bacterium]|nr:uracil-DNA glycosylase [Deltaproteobacteria bacterium]HQI80740.1 uracil-DNA glycosylase [Deltaproteobacteria bacterium]